MRTPMLYAKCPKCKRARPSWTMLPVADVEMCAECTSELATRQWLYKQNAGKAKARPAQLENVRETV